ncbi:hypothetical protein IJI31_03765 [bacterium]|nr:hypothetical protein [bacterium]
MISANNKINGSFSAKIDLPQNSGHSADETHLSKNNLRTNTRRFVQKTGAAFIECPPRGLKGDPNFDFYDFLTLGTVPYAVGSLTFMALFNGVGRHFDSFSKSMAAKTGNKLALGVLFYGIAKGLSKNLITKPVKWATGVDTEMPFENVVYSIPTKPGETNITKIQQRKVFDSVEFPRFDLLYDNSGDKNQYMKYYDSVAKRLGVHDDMSASDAKIKPVIKDIVSRTTTANHISSYLWAATGVAYALQQPWDGFFNALSSKAWKRASGNSGMAEKLANVGSNLKRIGSGFADSAIESAKSLWNGANGATGLKKHAGKIVLGVALASSVLGATNAIIGARKKAQQQKAEVIDRTKQTTVM